MTKHASEAADAAAADGGVLGVARAAPELSALSKLKEKNLAAQGLMILEGRIVIEKALEAGISPRALVCTEAEAEYWSAKQATAAPAFPLHVLSHGELCALVDFKFHRGAIAVAAVPPLAPFDAWAHKARYLCLWDVTDPSNLGALVRTAAGLGADGVLLGPGCASPYYRKTIRSSMGNVFSVPLWSIDMAGLAALRDSGARVVAAALGQGAMSPHEFAGAQGGRAATAGNDPASAPLVLVLGNEGYGLPDAVLSLCHDQVCIPMERGVDSLNVAVAGGILMYELLRGARA